VNPDREARVEQLFTAALERPLPERAGYVATRAETAEIRREVLSLLDEHHGRGRLDSLGEWIRGMDPAARAMAFGDLRSRLEAEIGDRYRIDREIGHGGMAIVLLAEDLKHGRQVALKVLRPDLAQRIGPDRFLHEIAIAAKLTHPHILTLHDSGEASGLLYYVMPFVDGESLRDRLSREKRIGLPEALRIIREVADALSYAHAEGVVHRDMKPDNIMLQGGHAIVTDFGIARAMSVAGGDALGETGLLLGTPPYMSPEQVRAERTVDSRSDIYGIACILFEMLAGRPPFAGGSSREILERHLNDRPPSLRRIVPDVPASVDATIRRALSKEPSGRFQDATGFVDALLAPKPRPLAKRRNAVTFAAGLAGAAVLGAIALAARTSAPVTAAPAVMAVLPLVPANPDTQLARLGRDLVVTLSANLDGVDEIRTVDALTVLAQTAQSGAPPVREGAELARRLGASTVAFGTIVRAESDVRIDLGLFTADSIRPLARVSLRADPDDLPAITDSLTWTLLRAAWRERAPPTPSIAGVTTRSLPALRAFLEGERAVLEGRWSAAADAFAQAMRADPAFWLAYWRYSYARWWHQEAVEDSILDPLYANRFELPERDRLVLESWRTDTIPIALARGREAVERYPDYWPGWMQYADLLFHVGPVHGYERSEARAALETVIGLNPSFLPAWYHLYWATIADDPPAAERALEEMLRLGFDRSSKAEFGVDITRTYRLELQVAQGGAIDEALLDSIAREIVDSLETRYGGGANLPGVQVEISRRVLRASPQPDLASLHENLLAQASAARGAWNDALDAAERYSARVGTDPLDAYRYAVVGAWFGALPPSAGVRLRPAAARAVGRAGASTTSRAELDWLDGLLSFERGDRSGLADARTRLAASASATGEILHRSLAALERGLLGDRAGAAETLAELNRDDPDRPAPEYEAHPYLIAVSRLTAARWFRETGRPADAVTPLMWFDAWWAYDGYRSARRVLAGPASLERARVAAMQGDDTVARQRYAEFLQRYDAPVPALRPLVEEARRAVH
jgi:TolB-like protein